MGWRDEMRPATFRDVMFYVGASGRTGGRRGVTHEYPNRNQSYREDLGRKARGFSVEGFVLGDDYFNDRDALLSVLEKEGPGELSHPYFGTRRVAVLTFSVRETPEEGGVARFTIEFEETPAQPAEPTAIPDAAGALVASADAAKDSVGTEFLAKYSPGALLDGLEEAVRQATLAVDNVLATVDMGVQEVATMRARVGRLQDSLTELVSTPADLLAGLLDLFDGFTAGTGDALIEIYGFDPGVRPPATTANREVERTNFDAIQHLVQRLVVIQAASIAPDQTFDSYDAAIAHRAALTDLIDEQAETAADDTYPALTQLRADLTKALPGADEDLPRLVSHTPGVTVPSLVLTYQLYGSLDLEADLLARNGVRNPGFVIGDRELEVLSNG